MQRMTKGEKAFQVFLVIFMFLLALIFILPFFVVLSTSLVSAEEAARRGSFILWPDQVSWTAYRLFLSKGSTLWRAYGNTVFITVVGTFLNLLVTSMLAYGLSRKNLPGRNFFITLIFITMIFSGGLIPTYLVVKTLKLTNTIWAMIIPNLVGTWNFVLLKTFFQQIPDSLEESAMLDGASPWQTLTRIILPLSKPALATIGLFYAVGHWNAWFNAAMYVDDRKLYPVQIILRNIVLSMSTNEANVEMSVEIGGSMPPGETVKCACIIITTLPIVCVYPFLQKYFVQGVVVGSIKE
ncbi:MAG: carbohydrate ABC transporter permease [Lachnospiraceae bacterium]|nr:carbohydrate ABC transporter permease [Lachnospiraceae bacterium]